ncbi:Tat pathway signal sequence domain protein [Micromonospora sp. NPDC023956]|uniref:Tat pathway signal sequence domain protein n=1 Tax=Micromonospora sp. NPDC023956 TaxID=3155722 RepID=UPI0033F9018F
MPRHGGTHAALAVAALLTTLGLAAPAAADPPPTVAVGVLTHTGVGGPDVRVGDVAQAKLKAGTTANLYSGLTSTTRVSCAESTFTASIRTNPVAPGTATASLTAQTFGSCTSTIPGTFGASKVVVDNLPFATAISSGGAVKVSGTNAAPIQVTVTLQNAIGALTCVYRANGNTISGVASNASAATSIAFTHQPFTRVSGPNTCFAAAYFSATYAPVRDISQPGSPIIYVN